MHIHILGICGTFMGGLAALARESGHKVTGCDANVYPPMSDQLRALGIELMEGYGADQLAIKPERRYPRRLMGCLHHLVTQLVHADHPLIRQPKDQFGAAAPADWIAVRVQLAIEQQALAIKVCRDIFGDCAGTAVSQPTIAGDIYPSVIERCEHY